MYGLTSVSTITAIRTSAPGRENAAQGLRIANEIKHIYTSCILSVLCCHLKRAKKVSTQLTLSATVEAAASSCLVVNEKLYWY
jgi:hypothetical protein